jgi:hypothetical protein
MANKKEEALELGTVLTVDGYEVIDLKKVTEPEIEYLTGKIGEANFYWFTDGKRHTGIEDPKDLILK